MMKVAWILRPFRNIFILLGQLSMVSLLMTACRPSGLNLDQSPLLRVLERKTGLIAYVGLDGNIYTTDQGGTKQTAITSDAQLSDDAEGKRLVYRAPTWSPDGKKLAYIGIQSTDGNLETTVLYTASLDGKDQVEAFRSDDHLPFYLDWSPDNELLAFLSLDVLDGKIVLHSMPLKGGEAKILGKGSSLYWDWSPDNQAVLLHLGGAARVEPDAYISLLNLNTELPEKRLDLPPSNFRSPAWSPDGEEVLLAAEIEDGQDGLVLADLQGKVKKVITPLEGPVAFAWSPDGNRLAYLTRDSVEVEDSPNVLTVLDPDNPEETRLNIKDSIFAYFFSPDSQKIAYFTPTLLPPSSETEESNESEPVVHFALNILDVLSGEHQYINTFQPTEAFSDTLAFFDQFQHSITIWSSDSKNLVISAIDADGDPGIFVVEALGNLKPRYIAPGMLAFWSWK